MDDNRITFHRLPRVKVFTSRIEFIQSYCSEKNVLHLGCVGTLESFNKGVSLHQKIQEVAAKVIGVDTDERAIEYLRQKGLSDLIHADVQAPKALDIPEIYGRIDVIVAGEILEHLPNPGLCLKNIANLMNEQQSVLLITVPNAFSFRNFFSVLSTNRELVRADHNYYFSYMTIKNLLALYDFSIADICVYSDLRAGQNPIKKIAKSIFNKTLLRYSPFLAEGLIIRADLQRSL